MAEPQPELNAYENARREAARVRVTLNFLVILSAAASSIFLVYVMVRIIPRGNGDAGNVEVPTSASTDLVGVLRGQSTGQFEVAFEIRDIDEARGYREKYSDQMREALGVREPGRLYQFSVRNVGKGAAFEFAGGTLTLREKGGGEYVAKWLASVASPRTPLGKMTLTQSEAKFSLAPGERRELWVFVGAKSGMPPAAEDLVGGSVDVPGLSRVNLERADVPIGR